MLFPTELSPQSLHLFLEQLPYVAQAAFELNYHPAHVGGRCFNGKMATQSHSFPVELGLRQMRV